MNAFLEKLLNGGFFERIYLSDYPTIPEACELANGKARIRGANIFLPDVCCLVDYSLSTIQFEINPTLDDSSDDKKYFNALGNTQAFEVENCNLKLYFNNRNNYLLFKRKSL